MDTRDHSWVYLFLCINGHRPFLGLGGEKVKIYCNECGNERDFILRKEVEIEFDFEKGIWDETKTTTSGGIIVCRECGGVDDVIVS